MKKKLFPSSLNFLAQWSMFNAIYSIKKKIMKRNNVRENIYCLILHSKITRNTDFKDILSKTSWRDVRTLWFVHSHHANLKKCQNFHQSKFEDLCRLKIGFSSLTISPPFKVLNIHEKNISILPLFFIPVHSTQWEYEIFWF